MLVQNIGHATLSIHCGDLRIITDPWLMQRLDRFWEHYPNPAPELFSQAPDVVFLSHHHYDHFHLPSLATLNRNTIILFPATDMIRAVTAPGGGVFAIPWVLRRLGFYRTKGLEPFEKLTLGDTEIICLPSAVPFREFSFLISDGASRVLIAGDSMLHSATKEWIAANDVEPTLSVLPVHSTATDACFRNREEMDDVVGKRREAALTFENYVRSFAKGVVIPGAFGWRVSTPAQSNDPDCEWMNHRIFPLTPADGFDIALGMGVEAHVWSPGDEVEVGGSMRVQGRGEHWDDLKFCRSISAQYAPAPADSAMPVFEPHRIGQPITSDERAEIVHFVESMIPQLISSKPFFMVAIERGLRTRLRITGGSDNCWIADFRSGKCEMRRSDSDDWDDSVWIAESAFLRLIQAKIPLGHTWGYWVASSPLLDALFSEPQYFMKYVESLLQESNWMERYGF